jgi:hypothetical protein
VHARGAVEAVAVEEGDGGDFEFCGAGDEVFWLGGGFEEGKGAGCVELYVRFCNCCSHIFSSGFILQFSAGKRSVAQRGWHSETG